MEYSTMSVMVKHIDLIGHGDDDFLDKVWP